MLLTGDARGDKILEGLELVGLLKQGGTLHVDVLKVPHHGSANNLEPDFFERITADHYVFSGDGEHGNPERESLEMLLRARGARAVRRSTSPTRSTRSTSSARRTGRRSRRRSRRRKQKKGSGKPRPNWSAEKHGLAAFFKNTGLADGQKISVVPEKKPHVIDFLDPLGY